VDSVVYMSQPQTEAPQSRNKAMSQASTKSIPEISSTAEVPTLC
jgi:hypothetical protein